MAQDISASQACPRGDGTRRTAVKAGVMALFGGLLAKSAAAAVPAGERTPSPSSGTDPDRTNDHLLDQFAVSQIIMRERHARETHDSDAEAACFHPEATVEVSWFSGTGAEFVEAGRKAAARGRAANVAGTIFFDSMSPAAIWVKGDRAIADTSCAVHAFAPLDGVEAHVTSYTRLLWRAQRHHGEWLIAGLRGIYIRDTLEACNPAQVPVIDVQKLATFRPSYRHLSYLLSSGGGPPRNDRAGIDRPDLVAALRAGERAWVEG